MNNLDYLPEDILFETLKNTRLQDVPAFCRSDRRTSEFCRSPRANRIIKRMQLEPLVDQLSLRSLTLYDSNSLYELYYEYDKLVDEVLFLYLERHPEYQNAIVSKLQSTFPDFQRDGSGRNLFNEILHLLRTRAASRRGEYILRTLLSLSPNLENELRDIMYNVNLQFILDHPQIIPDLKQYIRLSTPIR